MSTKNQTQINFNNKPISIQTEMVNKLSLAYCEEGIDLLNYFNTLVQRKSLEPYVKNPLMNVYDMLNGNHRTVITYTYNNKIEKVEDYATSKFLSKVKTVKKFILAVVNIMRSECTIDLVSIYEAFELYNNILQSREKQQKLGISEIKQISYVIDNNQFSGSFSFKFRDKLNVFKVIGQNRKFIRSALMEKFMEWYNNFIVYREEAEGQMEDVDDEAGVVTGGTPLENDVSKETVITSDVGSVSTMDLTPMPDLLRSASAGSIISEFNDLTERWLQIKSFRLVRDTGVTVQPWLSLELPKDVLNFSKNPVVLAFKQYKIAAPIEMEVKVKINSNKFNQGRLVISYLNDGAQMQVGTLQDSDSAWSSFRSVQQAIQRDHVMLDLNESNEVTIKIPFLSPKNFIPLYDSTTEYPYSSAVLDIHVLSALKVPDEAQSFVNGLIFIRFPRLAFTALRPSVDNFESIFADGQIEEAEGELPILPLVAGALITPLLKPIATGAGNLITGLINKIPLFGGMFKTSPVLGQLNAKRVDGGEREFDTRLQFLNADKPALHTQPAELRPNAVGDMAIGIKTQPQFSMRLDCTALTPQMQLMFPSQPVQSIYELNRIWNYVTKFNWTAAQQTVGEEIFEIAIHPLANVFNDTTFGTFGHMYQYYSGSLEFRFEFVGTQFHTGACSIGFVPFDNNFDMEDSKAAFYKLYDLREERQVGFHIPYIDTTVLRSTNPNETNGRLKFFVQNPLVPIGTVTQSVEVLVFVRFGEDAHYTFLKDPNIQLADGEIDQGEEETNEPTSDFGVLNASGILANIGEDHELIHDLLKRYVSYGRYDVTDVLEIPLQLSPIGMKNNNSGILMEGFRFVRGSYTLTLVIEKKPQNTVRFVRNRDVSLIPINGVSNSTVTNLPVPQSIGSISEPTAAQIGNVPSLTGLQSNFSFYQTNGGGEVEWTANAQDVIHVTGFNDPDFTTSPVTNRQFQDITLDGLANVAAVANNNTEQTDYNNELRTVVNMDTDSLNEVKTVMDTNVGINTFNTANYSSFNSLNSKVSSAFDIINTNSTSTNTNNNAIVAAIDEGTGGVVAAELPTQVIVSFKPRGITNYGFCGGPNQIVLTNINQTVKMNIPFYSMYNYQDHHYSKTGFGKELNVKFLGDLVIRTSDPINLEMYWSAGDDFYPTKFIGIPRTVARTTFIADGEMDNIADLVVDAATPKVSGFWHTTKDRVYDSAFSFKQRLVQPVSNLNTTIMKYDKLADRASEVIDTIKDTANKIMEYLTQKFSWLKDCATLSSSLIHLLQALLNPSLSSVALSIAGILVNLGLATFENAQNIISVIVKAVGRKQATTPMEQQTGVLGADGQCSHECSNCERLSDCFINCDLCSKSRCIFDKDTCATLAGLILSSISVALGLKTTVKTDGVMYGLFKLNNNFWSSLNGSIRFLKDLFKVFDRLWRRILMSQEEGAMAIALTQNRRDIIAFVEESQAMLSILNDSAVKLNPDQKRRFWLCVTKAYSLQAHLLTTNQPEKRTLLLHCERVIKKANDIGGKALNCPVRYEPFVLGLKGSSKLGKSYLLNALLPEVLADVYEFSSYTPPIYTRSPGTEYWNGYSDQPAIVYDDFLACTEPTMAGRQITELFGLKSSAIFNCNMANLEDKEKNANPLIVALAMNKAIVPNGITEPEAFLRRKDSFWIVEPKVKDGGDKANWRREQYTKEEQKNFEHLQFYKVPCVTDESKTEKPISYDDFKKRLKEEARKYHEQEKQNVEFRFEKLKLTLPEAARSMSMESDPFSVFYASCFRAAEESPVQTGMLPSEVLTTRLCAANNVTALIAEQSLIDENSERASGEIALPVYVRDIMAKIQQLPMNFKKRLFAMVHKQPVPAIRDAVYGLCSICTNENIKLIVHCNSRVIHGFCINCYLRAREIDERLLTQCATCRGVMTFNFDPALLELKNLMAIVASNSKNKIKALFKDYRTYAFLTGIGLIILDYYMIVGLSSFDAESEEHKQRFIHDVFKQEFFGGVDTKFGFSFYDPHKNAPKDSCGTVIMPFSTQCKTTGEQMWNYVKLGRHNDTSKFEVGNPYNHNIISSEGQVESEVNEELIEGITVKWYPEPAERLRPYGECSHSQLLLRNPMSVTYSWNANEGFGSWIDDDDNTHVDATCGTGCEFKGVDRRNFIKANILGRSGTYKLILLKLRSNLRDSEDMLPRELLNLDYMQQNNVALQATIARLQQHENVSLIDRLKGVFQVYGKAITIGLACGTAIISFVVGASQLMKFIKNDANEEDGFDGQLTSSGDFKTIKLKKVSKPLKSMFAKGQGGNADHFDMATTKISTNTIIVKINFIDRNGMEKDIRMRCLGLFGRTCIMTRHEMMFLLNNQDRCLKSNLKCSIEIQPFTRRGNSTTVEMKRQIVINHSDVKHFSGDFVFWELPVIFPQFKDITNLIASRAQHTTQFSTMTMLACDTRTAVLHKTEVKVFSNTSVVQTRKTDDYDSVTTYECYQTNYSKKGHCGSIGMVESNNPIMCYHFSGREMQNIGFALPLIREDIMDYKANKVPYSYLIPELANGEAAVPIKGDYWSVGLVPKQLTPYLSKTTKIMPSLINGQIEDTDVLTQPGILSPDDPRYKFEGSPLKWGCEKHLQPPKDLPSELINQAAIDMRNMLFEFCEPVRSCVGKLEISEAVLGIENLDYYDPIKLDTSSGYPYNLSKSGSKKSNLIVVERDGNNNVVDLKINKHLINDVEVNNEERERGVRPFTVFQDTLKDERRKAAKLEKRDGTRVFSQSPVDFTISTRQYYLDFAAAYMKHRYHLEHAVGINVNSEEWTNVAQKLLAKGNNIISGDFTDFGPRIWRQLVIKACELIDGWYKYNNKNTPNEHSLARKVIAEEISTTYHICNNHIYMVYCGIPSGHALTTILNSMVHLLLIRVCWLAITNEKLEVMKKMTAMIVYGDDHLISVSEQYKTIFNCETISEFLKLYDFKYTDAHKNGNIKYTKLKDAEFLKCGFKHHPNFPNKYLAPLDLISIQECAQWIFKTADIKLATRENAEQSIRLAFGHGPVYFDAWKTKVNDALIKFGIAPISVEWSDLNEMFFPEVLEYTEEGYVRIQSTGNYDVEEEVENLQHHFNPFNNSTELKEGQVYSVTPLISEYLDI